MKLVHPEIILLLLLSLLPSCPAASFDLRDDPTKQGRSGPSKSDTIDRSLTNERQTFHVQEKDQVPTQRKREYSAHAHTVTYKQQSSTTKRSPDPIRKLTYGVVKSSETKTGSSNTADYSNFGDLDFRVRKTKKSKGHGRMKKSAVRHHHGGNANSPPDRTETEHKQQPRAPTVAPAVATTVSAVPPSTVLPGTGGTTGERLQRVELYHYYLTYRFGGGVNMTRPPNKEERNALINVTEQFFDNLFQKHFNGSDIRFREVNIAFNYELMAPNLPTPNTNYFMDFNTTVLYEPDSPPPPSVTEHFKIMQASITDYQIYILNYVRQVPYFAPTNEVKFQATNTITNFIPPSARTVVLLPSATALKEDTEETLIPSDKTTTNAVEYIDSEQTDMLEASTPGNGEGETKPLPVVAVVASGSAFLSLLIILGLVVVQRQRLPGQLDDSSKPKTEGTVFNEESTVMEDTMKQRLSLETSSRPTESC